MISFPTLISFFGGDMDLNALNENFGLPGVLTFEDHNGLTRVSVDTPAARATVYLQGAHLTHWQPAGEEPVLFMSGSSAFRDGKAIRGGIPVIFPWFGDRHDGEPGPAHGFARTEEWEFAFAALAGDDIHLTLTLSPGIVPRGLGFDAFRVAYHLIIGKTLTLRLVVANSGQEPLVFEEALHTYFAVGDVRETSVTGLHGVEYLDKRDAGTRKTQVEDPLVLSRDTDRVYLDTAATCMIHDPLAQRRIVVAKSDSHTTIVWNPWEELAAKMADMEPGSWQRMICIESANAANGALTLASGESHTMECVVSVEPIASA